MAERGESSSTTFDDSIREQAEAYAGKLDKLIAKARPGPDRDYAQRKADSIWEAIGIVEGLSKTQAVEWIQANSGGGRDTTMDSVGEVAGNVWGRQTNCNVLSSWREILDAIAFLVDRG